MTVILKKMIILDNFLSLDSFNNWIKLNTPLTLSKLKELKAGDAVLLSGKILSARDAAHKKIVSVLENKNKNLENNSSNKDLKQKLPIKKLPVNLKNQVIFYMGPSPTPPGKNSGSIGPTTSSRMDIFTEPILKAGAAATIGKGKRSQETKELFLKYKAVYFIAPGGVAALLAKKVKQIKPIAYQELGPEAIYCIEVENLPVFVAYDIYGGDIFIK